MAKTKEEILDEAQEEAEADMTPMIDCVFLMIIFFLCIDFKILEAKLPAYLPKDKGSQSTEVEPQEQLSVYIDVAAEGTKEYFERDQNGIRVIPASQRQDAQGRPLINSKTKRPYRFVLKGHKIRWMVGPTPIRMGPPGQETTELLAELLKIYNTRETWRPDKDNPGELKPMPVVIEPRPGTYYADVAMTVDAVKAADFEEINFGGGLGAKK